MVIPIIVGQLPSGFCPASYQQMAEAFAAIYEIDITNSNLGIVASASKPDPSLQGSVVWQRLDTIGRPIGIYWFAQGAWLSPHPELPLFAKIWFGPLPDFTVFDGGDANALSDISGPMWEVAAELDAKIPIGVGKLPSDKVLALGDTGGEENHVLAKSEMPPHAHAPSADSSFTFVVAGGTDTGGAPANTGSNWGKSSITAPTGGDPVANPPVAAKGHNTLPPYSTVYFLRRTARLFYAVN